MDKGGISSRKTRDRPYDEYYKKLIENFVELQKVMTNLAVKFDNLSSEISKLLHLFEVSAKTFVEKQTLGLTKEDKEFLEKLDKLLEQNKLIARGLTMMEERIRDKLSQGDNKIQIKEDINARQLPRF